MGVKVIQAGSRTITVGQFIDLMEGDEYRAVTLAIGESTVDLQAGEVAQLVDALTASAGVFTATLNVSHSVL